MSMKNVQTIIIRAVFEPEYCDLLFGDIESALEGYDLTPMEILWLRRLTRKEFEGFAPDLENSLTRGGMQSVNPVQV
ncbi:MAG: hypothetical protein GTO14_25255 [Anaerolineales bacterium]|nr:hypothetical protein [Anaerolineales bacterium]